MGYPFTPWYIKKNNSTVCALEQTGSFMSRAVWHWTSLTSKQGWNWTITIARLTRFLFYLLTVWFHATARVSCRGFFWLNNYENEKWFSHEKFWISLEIAFRPCATLVATGQKINMQMGEMTHSNSHWGVAWTQLLIYRSDQIPVLVYYLTFFKSLPDQTQHRWFLILFLL